MGCDIHLHIEIKINGKWEHYAAPSVWRNYRLFHKLAGVRAYAEHGPIEPICEPRGIPEDASPTTALDWMRGQGVIDGRFYNDWHTPSWINAQEIALLEDWCHANLPPSRDSALKYYDLEWETGCYLFGNSFGGFAKYPEERPKGVEDVRFIFWYDN